jgi:hypothetical protein
LVQEYGVWSDLQGNAAGCYTVGSRWRPSLNNTVYFAVSQLNSSSTEIAIVASSAPVSNPIPGGCATTGLVADDPMLQLTYTRAEINTMTFQQANFGMPRVAASPQHGCSCDAVSYYADITGTLQYDVYRTFVSDCGSDFKRTFYESPLLRALEQMTTVAGVKRHGRKITQTPIDPPSVKSLDAAVRSGQVGMEPGLCMGPFRTSVVDGNSLA